MRLSELTKVSVSEWQGEESGRPDSQSLPLNRHCNPFTYVSRDHFTLLHRVILSPECSCAHDAHYKLKGLWNGNCWKESPVCPSNPGTLPLCGPVGSTPFQCLCQPHSLRGSEEMAGSGHSVQSQGLLPWASFPVGNLMSAALRGQALGVVG